VLGHGCWPGRGPAALGAGAGGRSAEPGYVGAPRSSFQGADPGSRSLAVRQSWWDRRSGGSRANRCRPPTGVAGGPRMADVIDPGADLGTHGSPGLRFGGVPEGCAARSARSQATIEQAKAGDHAVGPARPRRGIRSVPPGGSMLGEEGPHVALGSGRRTRDEFDAGAWPACMPRGGPGISVRGFAFSRGSFRTHGLLVPVVRSGSGDACQPSGPSRPASSVARAWPRRWRKTRRCRPDERRFPGTGCGFRVRSPCG